MRIACAPTAPTVQPVARAADLPAGWDALCGTLLQTRALLAHYEATNPCRQRYYVLCREGRVLAGAVVYEIVQDLFTFLGHLPSPVRLNVVGLPASVPASGLLGAPEASGALLREVFAVERGFTVALNLPPGMAVPGTVPLRLLPDMVWRNTFASLEEYLSALRAPWRRRLRRSRERFAGVRTVRTLCAEFTPRHHRLYLDVLARASQRLETLTPAFFRGLPRPLELVSCYRDGALLCWRIVLAEGARLLFVLGGHDYAQNERHDVYFNNLLGVLADGIASGASHVDLGQTAEDPKARLGAEPVETRMLLRHGNPLIGLPLRAASPLLAYRGRPRAYRVYREGAAP